MDVEHGTSLSKYFCVALNDNIDGFGEKTFVVKQTKNHPLPTTAKANLQCGHTKWDTNRATPVMTTLYNGQMHVS